jgi:hypothetical protein
MQITPEINVSYWKPEVIRYRYGEHKTVYEHTAILLRHLLSECVFTYTRISAHPSTKYHLFAAVSFLLRF